VVNTGAGLKYPRTVPARPALVPAGGRIPDNGYCADATGPGGGYSADATGPGGS